MQKRNADSATFLKILKTIDGKKKFLFVLLFIHIFQAVLSVGYALFFRNIIDSAVSGDKGAVINNITGLSVLVLIQLLLRVVSHFLSEYTKSDIENALKSRLFSDILCKDYQSVTATHSGEWLNLLTNDTVIVADGLTSIIPNAFSTVIRMVIAFFVLTLFIPKFAIFLFLIGAVLVSVTVIFRKISKKLHISVQEADGKLRVFLTEQINSLMMLKVYGKEKESLNNAQECMCAHKDRRMRRNWFLNLSSSGFSFAMNTIRVLAALYSGLEIISGNISYGTFTAVMQLLGQIQGPIANISGYAPRYYAMLASAERIFTAGEYPDDNPDKTNFDAHSFYENELLSFGFQNAGFSYNAIESNCKTVLKNVDFSVKKGEFVAVTGESGCGKSTALKLILSLYNLDSGECYLHTINGNIPLNAAHRELFAYVPQGNVLMNATIREVVAFFEENPDEQRIMQALKIAVADGFVSELPDGIDTYLGERGAGLSEGEMQRISIARAIYSGRPVLLLDEATSALDAKTEEKLLENIKTMTNKTVVIVTHKTKALGFTDRIYEFSE